MDDTKDKKPNNIVPFPKKFKRPISPEQDKEMQKKIAVEHQKIFCQQMADELCENILVRLHGENIKVTDKTFLKDLVYNKYFQKFYQLLKILKSSLVFTFYKPQILMV